MKKIRLGRTNLQVSRIGIGGIPLTRPSESEAIKLIHHALDLGINFIDTARGYGISEMRIGKAISDRRDKVILATKGWGADKKTALECLNESLKQLNTDYIDLWQIHGINLIDQKLEDVVAPDGHLEAAQEALKAGKIRHFGFSCHNIDAACKAVASDYFETVQYPLNFISNEAEEKLISLAQKHDIGFIGMKPFAGGRIKDANLAFKYLLQFDTVMPDPGIEKIEEIEEIVNIVNKEINYLTGDELEEISKIRRQVGKIFCRQCEYCIPCPQGVHIPGGMYLKILWELWPPHLYLGKESIGWYVNNAVEKAKECTKCGVCETKCPYQLSIREMIEENIIFYKQKVEEYSK